MPSYAGDAYVQRAMRQPRACRYRRRCHAPRCGRQRGCRQSEYVAHPSPPALEVRVTHCHTPPMPRNGAAQQSATATRTGQALKYPPRPHRPRAGTSSSRRARGAAARHAGSIRFAVPRTPRRRGVRAAARRIKREERRERLPRATTPSTPPAPKCAGGCWKFTVPARQRKCR